MINKRYTRFMLSKRDTRKAWWFPGLVSRLIHFLVVSIWAFDSLIDVSLLGFSGLRPVPILRITKIELA